MIEIKNIENQETFEEVYLDDDMKMISGKWVDTEKTPGVAKARWVLRGFEERAAKDDCYAATASLVAVRLILVWILVARAKFPDITLFLGDIKGAFLKALMKDGEVAIAQPPPEWQPTKLKANFQRVVWKLRKALYGLRTSPNRWQAYFGEILKEMGFESHPPESR